MDTQFIFIRFMIKFFLRHFNERKLRQYAIDNKYDFQ